MVTVHNLTSYIHLFNYLLLTFLNSKLWQIEYRALYRSRKFYLALAPIGIFIISILYF